MSDSALLERLAKAIEGMDANAVKSLAKEALAAGMSPATVLNDGLSLGMRRVGQQFNAGDMFMPEVLVACDVYFAGLEVVRPLLAASGGENVLGTMVLGNIHGDIHTVGKNVAVPVFEANGLRVIDVGESLDDQVFVEAIRKHKPQIVGLGTYMTSTFMHTKETVGGPSPRPGSATRSRSSAAGRRLMPRRLAGWAPTTPAMMPGRPSRRSRSCWGSRS